MNWSLLVLTLPAEANTARMRVWRAIKGSGAAVLRDGVYLLPQSEANAAVFAAVADDVRANAGSAWALAVSGDDTADFPALFDRTAFYRDFTAGVDAARRELERLADGEIARLLRKQRKLLEQIVAIDFFPGTAQAAAAMKMQQLEAAAVRRQAPDEPQPQHAAIVPRALAQYQGRIWATRRRPKIDRLASAWLILRHIDPRARFMWLAKPGDCPTGALGFDFDDAEFTHAGAYVTFETLVASFALSHKALPQLAAIVHALDVGGARPPEADGLERILDGYLAAIPDDDALLQAVLPVFDGLAAAFSMQDPTTQYQPTGALT